MAIGDLSWESAKINFLYHGIHLVKVRIDSDGLNVDHLEEICQQKKIKLVFVTPHHQYPTTAIMPAYRRIKLLQLAQQFGFLIFEDDYDYDFHFSRHPIMPLASAFHQRQVLYAGSFTKAISPVFRVGYLVGSKEQIDLLCHVRRLVDRQGDTIQELALNEILKTGIIQRYLRKNRRIYQLRRDCFISLLSNHLADFVSYSKPEGGMAIWTKFRSDIDLAGLAKKALNHDLYFQDGTQFHSSPDGIHCTRLGFASSSVEELTHAVEILSDLVFEQLKL
ncbi:MAG: PLP-dependent aminotransferase family protein [Saprospiraceae bacterium]|nr:PLP-dependent aminotransferase family protein [Saprospiraceae bacterium]